MDKSALERATLPLLGGVMPAAIWYKINGGTFESGWACMAVTCVVCGQATEDAEFCDVCNADQVLPAERWPPARCPLDETGVLLSDDQRRLLARGENALTLAQGDSTWRIYWLPTADARERLPLLQRRFARELACLPGGRLQEEAAGVWVLIEATGQAWAPWKRPPASESFEELARLLSAVRELAHLLEELHRQHLVWLTFDPAALEAGPQGPRITNLDVTTYPAGRMPEGVALNARYAAPEAVGLRAAPLGPRTDVFHLALFTYCWVGQLLPEGIPGVGLEAFDYALPEPRVYAPWLPEGIVAVLQQGLALEPRQRPATPTAFVTTLEQAVETARRRRAFAGVLTWELGGTTRTGASKTALGRINEDAIYLHPMPDGRAALVMVADGISTCHVGSGALASLLTSIVIEQTFAAGSTHGRFAEQAASACREAAQGLLDWAVEKGYGEQLLHGLDLMGTTLLLGWLEGRQLSLANLGDSRAYLITDTFVEALTVDGDLASTLLARRVPPEDVRELGSTGRALRECVGGCIVTRDRQLRILPESAHPVVSRWPLLPGDVVVLCTDGLVEEQIFLEPATMAALVRRNRQRSAQELALLLTDAADALQRPPSPGEPDGFGDNISCVVLKIGEAVSMIGERPA